MDSQTKTAAARGSARRPLLWAAILISLAMCLDVALNIVNGRTPSQDLLEVCQYAVAFLLIAWLSADPALPAEHRPSFDHGLLLWVSFPLLACYQQCISHGWKGLGVIVALLLVLLAPFVTWTVMYLCWPM